MFKYLIALLALSGCAIPQVQMANDSSAKSNYYNRAYVAVVDQEMKKIDSPLANSIKGTAESWLTKKGFNIVTDPVNADIIVGLSLYANSKEVYVPPTQSTIPIYGSSSRTANINSNSSVYSSSGQYLGNVNSTSTVTETSSPLTVTGYYSVARGGYNTTVTDEIIFLSVFLQTHGYQPRTISTGRVQLDTYNESLFGSELNLKRSLSALMAKTILASSRPMQAPIDSKPPGCWPRIGIRLDENGIVTEVEARSPSSENYLKPGDQMIWIEGALFEEWKKRTHSYSEGEKIRAKVKRNSKEIELDLEAKLVCASFL